MKTRYDRVGERYVSNKGEGYEIIRYTGKDCTTIMFDDETVIECLNYNDVKHGRVRNPNSKSFFNIGCIGQGVYKSSENKELTKICTHWLSMLTRCYSNRYVQYKGCSIAEEWHNFQNFAKWFEENYNPEVMEGWELDKDVLFKGNKIYSPDTCSFVPKEINMLFVKCKKSRGCYPVGVYKNKNRFIARVRRGGNRVSLGSFDTPEEAFQAYKTAKEKHIKETAEKYKGLISERVYQVLKSYTVEITD